MELCALSGWLGHPRGGEMLGGDHLHGLWIVALVIEITVELDPRHNG
jgi:hypothetical protein